MSGRNSPLSLRKLAFLTSVGLIPATSALNANLSQEDYESVEGLFGLRSHRVLPSDLPIYHHSDKDLSSHFSKDDDKDVTLGTATGTETRKRRKIVDV